ncbi:AAA family ATPase (plasmid) [Streptomyces sp. HUAS TT11]|uniref:AAA family ATPase n=1 Tax=Streptomyces sp. HUAS TT11 TaxID=3447508 RepID=UPI003F65E4DD
MSEVVRQARRLIVIAVDDYADGNAEFTKGINDQVAVVTGWLTDSALGPDRQFSLQKPKETLHSVQQVHQFLNCQDLAGAQPREAVIVYITGHGQRGPSSGRHYLRFARTDDGRLPGTALTTGEVVSAVLASTAQHVLVLVDSCFAGALANDVQPVLRDLTSRSRLTSLAVVTSGNFDEQPLVGSFTELLRRALDKIEAEESGFAQPYLSFSEWRHVLDAVHREDRGLVEAKWVWPERLSEDASLCLPNPRFEAPKDLGNAVRALPDAAGLFDGYWRERASGRTHERDTGWYFSGRHDAMRTLTEFLTRGCGVMVVTGAAGSGKSALLARLVTLTDQAFLDQPDLAKVVAVVPDDERPAAGSVDAAVLARNKTSLALIEDLLRALGAEAVPAGTAPLRALQERLAARAKGDRVPTVVIDALDEARDSLACLNDVILPIARLRSGHQPLVRMVVGVRSSPHASPGAAEHLTDADADELLRRLCRSLEDDVLQVPVMLQRTDDPNVTDDIAAYVEALLSGDDAGPYADKPGQAEIVAREVACAVAPSFLDARLAADQLRTAQRIQDVTAPAWQERLSQGTVALLHEDLHEVARHHGVPVATLVRVMRATAFAAGSGLPWAEVWPSVAQALIAPADDMVSTEAHAAAIRTVQTTRLTGYLARSTEDGRLTYRPVHQQVSKALLQQPYSLADASPATAQGHEPPPPLAEEHARITQALALLLPADSATVAHPYVRRHLVAHAAVGNVLNDAHVPLQLLAQETSHTLRERLGLPLPASSARNDQVNVAAAALIEPYLAEGSDPASRYSSIALHALTLRHNGRPAEPSPAALSAQWGWWQSATNVLASPGQYVRALIAIEVSPGRTLIAAGTKNGAHVWDASNGQRLADLPAGLVDDMCVVRGRSRSFLATAGSGGVAIWDPLSGLQINHNPAPASAVQVVSDGDQRWQLLSRFSDYSQIWKPDQNHVDAVPFMPDEPSRSSRGIHTVIRTQNGQPLLASPDADGLALRDFRNGELRARVPMPRGRLRRLMSLRRPGRTDLVLAAFTDRMLTWDPDTGDVLPVGRGPAAYPAQFDLPDGRTAIALERRNRQIVEVWELGEAGWNEVASVAVGEITQLTTLPSTPGRWLVATAGEAGLRLWHPDPDMPLTHHGTAAGPVTAITALQVPSADGRVHHRWVVGSRAGVEVMDLEGSDRISWHLGQVQALHALSPGRVAVLADSGTHIWQPPAGAESVRGPLTSLQHESWTLRWPDRMVANCVVNWPPGCTRIATARSGGILLEDIEGGQAEYVDIPSSPAPRAVVALPAADGTTPRIAVGTRRGALIWDLQAQREVTNLRVRGQRSDTWALTLLHSGATTLLAAATREGIHIWDTADWSPQARITTPWTKSLAAIALTPTHHLLASGSGHALHLWDPASGELLHSLITAAPVDTIASAPEDGSVFIAIGGPAGLAALRVNFPTL